MEVLNVLVADDEESFCEIFKDLLTSEKTQVFSCSKKNDVLDKIINHWIHVLLLDQRFPEPLDGLETLKLAKCLKPEIEVIVLTAFPDPEVNLEVMRHGAFAYLLKTDNYDTIVSTVNHLLDTTRIREQNILLLKQVEEQNSNLEKSQEALQRWNKELLRKVRSYQDMDGLYKKELAGSNFELFSLAFTQEIRRHLEVADSTLSRLSQKMEPDLPKSMESIFSVVKSLFEVLDLHCQMLHASPGNPIEVDVNSILEKTISIAKAYFAQSGGKIEKRLTARSVAVKCFPRKLIDALFNLIKFAIDISPKKVAQTIEVLSAIVDGSIQVSIGFFFKGELNPLASGVYEPEKDEGKPALKESLDVLEAHGATISFTQNGNKKWFKVSFEPVNS